MLVNEFLEESASLLPDKVALVCNSKRLTFKDIDQAANSLGNALLEAGFRRQDRAIIYLENSAESVVSIFGILKAGGIFSVIHPQMKARKIENILDNCEASTLITSKALLKYVFETVMTSSSLKRIILIDTEDATLGKEIGHSQVLPYNKITKESSASKPVSSCIDSDIAGLVYTSGSTGTPKGVMLTHLNIASAATSIIQYLGNTRDDIIMNTLPLAFGYGLCQVLTAFKFGGTVILEKSFVYPQHVINLVVKEKVTGWPMVPTMAAILLRLNNLDNNDFSRLRYITNAGQAMPPKHFELLQETFPKTKIFSMYGLTECLRVSYLSPEQLERRPESVGKAIPNTEVCLVDTDGSVITQPGKTGELVVRGTNVMRGYWNLPKETENRLRSGPYPGEHVLYTGDLFNFDDEGYLYFLGRKDDIIKTGGHMVSPREVENVLYQMDDIVEAAVIGIDDNLLGKAVVAFVCLNDSSTTDERAILDTCFEKLEEYAVPKRIIIINSLPKLSNGKIAKQELKYEIARR